MSERDAFRQILAELHEAAFEPVRWANASALIDEALGTHGSTLLFGAGDTDEDIRLHFSGENSRFKLGISSADGETSAWVGAGWSF